MNKSKILVYGSFGLITIGIIILLLVFVIIPTTPVIEPTEIIESTESGTTPTIMIVQQNVTNTTITTAETTDATVITETDETTAETEVTETTEGEIAEPILGEISEIFFGEAPDWETYDFSQGIINRPSTYTMADLEQEFYQDDFGNTIAWPIAHTQYDRAPVIRNMELLQNWPYFIFNSAQIDGDDVIFVGNAYNFDGHSRLEDIKIRLCGISCYTTDQRSQIEDILNSVLDSRTDIVESSMFYIEEAELPQNPDGTYNAYLWGSFGSGGAPEYQLVQEYLLRTGICEPNLDPTGTNSKYDNWFIQYPPLYFVN